MKKYYININEYDIVIGFRADDAYFRFPLMFIRNVLTLEKLKEIYVNGKLGKQYVLISNKAFKRIKYLSCLEVDFIYHEKYLRRLDAADNSYKALEILEAKSKGTRIKDLINHD